MSDLTNANQLVANQGNMYQLGQSHSTPIPKSDLTKALVKARKAVSGIVLKEGRATMGGAGSYSYVGHEDVIRHARSALLDAGLALIEVSSEFLRFEPYKTKSGEATVAIWRGRFVLSIESGESLALGYDCLTQAGDKAGFVASTALDRTAILRVLHLAGSDFVDVPASEDPEHNANNQAEPTLIKQAAAKQNAADQAAQRQKHVRDIIEHEGFLEQIEKPDLLIVWGLALMELPGGSNDKKRAWDALGKRCDAVGLDPKDVRVGIEKALKAGGSK